MKRVNLLLMGLIMLITCFLPQDVIAQDKTDQELERSLRIQQAINRQKRSLVDEQRSMEEMRRGMNERNIEIEKILSDTILNGLDTVIVKSVQKGLRNAGRRPFDDQFAFSYGQGMDPFVLPRYGNDEERTSWNFSKSVKDATFSSSFDLDVENTAKSVSMSVMGDCKTGEIKISIYMPGGKKYSDIILDESGNLNWRKSFDISEKDNKDKTGDWKFRIEASKATGFFRISLQTL